MAIQTFDAVIALAGQQAADDIFASLLLSQSKRLIAADGGADHIMTLGYTPHYVVGDFDSIEGGKKREFSKTTNILKFPTDKYHTDGELALSVAVLLALGKPIPSDEFDLYDQFDRTEKLNGITLLFLNYFGSRHDHTLANIALSLLASRRGADVFLTDGTTLGRLVTGPAKRYPVFSSDYFSQAGDRRFLFSAQPLDDVVEGLTLKGLQWELHDVKLPLTRSLALSNRSETNYPDCVNVQVDRGTLALFTFPEDL